MLTNALLAMFKNRLDNLDTAISGIETHLNKAKECGNDILRHQDPARLHGHTLRPRII